MEEREQPKPYHLITILPNEWRKIVHTNSWALLLLNPQTRSFRLLLLFL